MYYCLYLFAVITIVGSLDSSGNLDDILSSIVLTQRVYNYNLDLYLSVFNTKFRINVQFDEDNKDLYLQKIITEAIQSTEKIVAPKYAGRTGIWYHQPCIDNQYIMDKGTEYDVKYCTRGCIKSDLIPDTFKQKCTFMSGNEKNITINSGKHAINTDLVLFVKYVDCPPQYEHSHGYPIQLSGLDNRPEIGVIFLCREHLEEYSKDPTLLVKVIKRSMIQVLGMSPIMLAYWRDDAGRPLTPRDEFGNPNNGVFEYLNIFNISRPSEKVLRWTKRVEQYPSGSREVVRPLLVTKYIKNESQYYFNCSTLPGMYLENYKTVGVYLSSFEKRLLNNELMTPTITKSATISEFTLAVLNDTGFYWIQDNYTKGYLSYGRNKGCDFVEKNCYEYKLIQENQNKSTSPFCFRCTNVNINRTLEHENMCVLIHARQTSKNYSDVEKYSEGDVIYPEKYSENCPIYKKYYDEIKPTNGPLCFSKKNTVSRAKLNFLSWKKHFCSLGKPASADRVKPPFDVIEYECDPDYGLLFVLSGFKFQCNEENKKITVNTFINFSLYTGELRCPKCTSYCGSMCLRTNKLLGNKKNNIVNVIEACSNKGKSMSYYEMFFKNIW